jgi:hypothetical protein
VCGGGVEFVEAFKSGMKDREVEDGVVVHVKDGVSFEGVELEEVLDSSAKGSVVLLKVCDR